jgi:hypothetical protein
VCSHQRCWKLMRREVTRSVVVVMDGMAWLAVRCGKLVVLLLSGLPQRATSKVAHCLRERALCGPGPYQASVGLYEGVAGPGLCFCSALVQAKT